jgi:Putative peptidoglycan binding domain
MKTAQFNTFLGVLIVFFAGLGYFTYRSISFSFDRTVPESNSEKVVIVGATANTNSASIEQAVPAPVATTPVVTTPTVTVDTSTTKKIPSQYTNLAKQLQGLIDDNITMKIGSKGTRVGTVQEFLNAYEGKNIKPDNGYGEGTKKRVLAFQKAVGDNADGLADPKTYQKMLDWLAK